MRSPVPWFGGKYVLRNEIISLFPPHHTYAEPFGGGASVLLSKPPAAVEVYNDLNSEIVILFRVLRDQPEALYHMVELTPYSREEFATARRMPMVPDNDLETARRVLVKYRMMFGGGGQEEAHGWGYSVAETKAGMAQQISSWLGVPELIRLTAERFRRVQIDHRPAMEILRAYDTPETLFYIDPPYLPETRTKTRYAYEMDWEGHKELLGALSGMQGMVVLSGYRSSLYDEALVSWERHEFAMTSMAGAGRKRHKVEVVWLNAAAANRRSKQMTLTGEG